MKHSFVYFVWGIHKDSPDYIDNNWFQRRSKIDNDIQVYKNNPYSSPAVFYVFGRDNYNKLSDIGLSCKLIDKRPIVFDMQKEQYAHRLLGLEIALTDYDEIINPDIDVVALKPLPSDFWSEISKGSPIKSTIYLYHRRRLTSRGNDSRKLSSASFLYIRGKHEFLKMWEELGRPWKEEIVLSQYIDDMDGGWQGVEKYSIIHEPRYYCIYPCYPQHFYDIEVVPRVSFAHFNNMAIERLLRAEDLKTEIDNSYRRYLKGFFANNKSFLINK